MADIFQRIFYTSAQCKILDFIKKNKDFVTYTQKDKLDKHDMCVGITHKVSIRTDEMILQATLTKYKPTFLNAHPDSNISYSFRCYQSGTKPKCRNCTWETAVSKSDDFAPTVYAKMLNHYISKHGCPIR